MSEIFKVKKASDDHTLEVIHTDSEMSRVYATFNSSSLNGANRSELLKRYKELFDAREKLDEQSMELQDYFMDIVSDLHANELSRRDKASIKNKIKKMEKRLKNEKCVEDEDDEDVKISENKDVVGVSQALESFDISEQNKQFIVKPDPKFFVKENKSEVVDATVNANEEVKSNVEVKKDKEFKK